MNTGCALATFAPKSTMRSLPITSVYEHVVAATPIVLLERGGRRGMADARRIVDVVRADDPRHLLRDVVHLVRDAARREVERERVGIALRGSGRRSRSSASSHETRVKPRSPAAPHHRVRQPAELAQLGAARASGAARRRRAPPGRARRMVLTRSRLSRVVQRCTPESVQSWKPATPSAQPSHTPLRRIRHAYGRLRRFSHTTFAMSP